MTAVAYDPVFLRHEAPGHVECPERLVRIVEHLRREGLWEKLAPLPVRPATDEELATVHTVEHVRRIREARGWIDADTYVNEHSLDAALKAAGAAIDAARAIRRGEHRSALCLVRPPGHHATPDRAMGFCLLNNAALAARAAGGRVLIVDWDVHHGNGTQDVFRADPRVFYFSMHRFPFYPGTGWEDETGVGNVVNLPIRFGTARDEVLRRFDIRVAEIVERFGPDFVVVSCGFDAYEGDPIGGLGLGVEDYAAMTRVVREATGAPILSVLEGGYALDALGPLAAAHVRELLRVS